jgi:hypothetical protein
VSRNNRELLLAPLLTHSVDIGMADASILDVNDHIRAGGGSASKGEGLKRLRSGEASVSFDSSCHVCGRSR